MPVQAEREKEDKTRAEINKRKVTKIVRVFHSAKISYIDSVCLYSIYIAMAIQNTQNPEPTRLIACLTCAPDQRQITSS